MHIADTFSKKDNTAQRTKVRKFNNKNYVQKILPWWLPIMYNEYSTSELLTQSVQTKNDSMQIHFIHFQVMSK